MRVVQGNYISYLIRARFAASFAILGFFFVARFLLLGLRLLGLLRFAGTTGALCKKIHFISHIETIIE